MMDITWILVANRSAARIFESKGASENIKEIRRLQEILHPEGRLRNRDINSDDNGRSFDRFGEGRHATGVQHGPTEHISKQFARQLSRLLYRGYTEQAYKEIILVAEPGFLGELVNSLDNKIAKLVTRTVKKDLININDREIVNYLN